MFDDFMHNDFPEMHLNQVHQDAMLHAQNQAMDQAVRVQWDAERAIPSERTQVPKTEHLIVGVSNASVNLSLLVSIIRKIFHNGND